MAEFQTGDGAKLDAPAFGRSVGGSSINREFHIATENGPVEIVGFPIQHGDVAVPYVSQYRVGVNREFSISIAFQKFEPMERGPLLIT